MYQGLEADLKPRRASLVVVAVKKVVDRQKTNAEEGKDLLQIPADLDIISAKAGKILDSDTVYLTFSHLFQHIPDRRPVNIRTRMAVVYENIVFDTIIF
jgi:hypothetical protein